MVTTIRNNVGSNLYRPFALGQRLLFLRRLQDASDSLNTNVVSDDAHLQSRFNGRGTPSFAPTRRSQGQDASRRYVHRLRDRTNVLCTASLQHTPVFQ